MSNLNLEQFNDLCCKVRPYLYDDSMSGYEFICTIKEMVDKIIEILGQLDIENLTIKDLVNFGGVGDGVVDETVAIRDWLTNLGIGVIGEGQYMVDGILTNLDKPRIFFNDNAIVNNDNHPYITIAKEPFLTQPQNYLFIQHDTNDRNDATSVQIQRLVNTDDGYLNPKALRVVTQVNTETNQTEWAISGELTNNIDTGSSGNTAVSGVSNKHGLASVFGGHFQGKDYNIYATPTDVTAVLGVEINTPSIGLDHPTANNGTGVRRCMDIIGRTNQEVVGFTDGEIGVGIAIRTDNATDGFFRYGLMIDDISQVGNPNPITTGALIRTSGADGVQIKGNNTASALRIVPSVAGNIGIVIQGNFASNAIRIDDDENIGFSTDGTKKIKFESSNDEIRILDNLLAPYRFGLSGDDGFQILSDNAVTNMRINPTTAGQYGMILQGDYSVNAIRIDDGEYIGLSSDGSKKVRYSPGSDSIEFFSVTDKRFGFRLNATPKIFIGDDDVIGERIKTWVQSTGTPRRSGFNTATATTEQVAETVKALIDDLFTHGLIGNA